MSRAALLGLGAAATLIVQWSGPGLALAAPPGSVAFGSCISESSSECALSGFGLQQPTGVAVSPDGANVYVAGAGGGSVVVLDRAASGALSFGSCLGGALTLDPQCDPSAGVIGPEAVAVSPDGRNVYVLDHGQIDMFARAADGSLSSLGCVGDVDQSGCAGSAPGHTLDPYRYPGAIAVSPDGAYLYTATDDGGGINGAIDVFARGAGGTLSAIGCIASTGGLETACSSETPALVGAASLAVSSDGYVYVGGASAVAAFEVGSGGALRARGCIGSASGCTSASGLAGQDYSPDSVAVSPDGSTVYAASYGSGAIEELGASAGQLTELGCLAGSAAAGCKQQISQLCGPQGLAVSADGNNVYAVDSCSDSLLTFARDASGILTYQSCLSESSSSDPCVASAPGLDFPVGLAIAPDGSQLYVTGEERDSLAAFTRTPNDGPEVSITTPSDGEIYVAGAVVRASYACTRASGGAPIVGCDGTAADGADIDTAAGTHSFTVTATDLAGLVTRRTVTYSAVGLGTPGAGAAGAGGGAAEGGGGGSAGHGGIARSRGGTSGRLAVHGFGESHATWVERRVRGRRALAFGTRFSFKLSRAATVTLKFRRRIGRHRVRAAGKLVVRGRAGLNVVKFSGGLGRHRYLRTGTYSVTLTATAPRQRRATASPLRFTIVVAPAAAPGASGASSL